MHKVFSGIKGLSARKPVGAVLRIGRKAGRGFPTDRDQFYLVSPKQDSTGCRPLHPAFTYYNRAPEEQRRSLSCILVHASQEQACNMQLMCYRAPGLASHPDGFPSCTGDGDDATRWTGERFEPIPCPGERCQYRQPGSTGKGAARACKPDVRLLFQPVWAKGDMPTPLCEFASKSWNTAANLLGFFEYLRVQAQELGVAQPNLYGFQFQLTLTEQTKPSKKARFPVVTISPSVSVQEFFWAKAQQGKQLSEVPQYLALTDHEMHEPDIIEQNEVELSGRWPNTDGGV